MKAKVHFEMKVTNGFKRHHLFVYSASVSWGERQNQTNIQTGFQTRPVTLANCFYSFCFYSYWAQVWTVSWLYVLSYFRRLCA